jgi:hypothetical protein
LTKSAHRDDKSMDTGRRSWIKTLSGLQWRNVVTLVILAILLIGFVVDGWAQIVKNWNSYKTDQTAYLRLALRIRQGIALTDGNRHPLYPAILALFAQREWVFFTTAKLLNLFIATLALLVVFWIVKRISSVHAALFTVFLLSHTDYFLEGATKVIVEPLLVLLMFVTWFLVWEGRGAVRWWGLAGVGAGLAYLAKGTGQIVPIVFILAAVLIYRTKVFRRRAVWVFLAGYVVLAAGLWLYNTLTYGNPFYNVNTSYRIWLSQWQEKYVADPSQLPTAATYLQTHSLTQIGQRLLTGLVAVWSSMRQAWFPMPDVLVVLCLAIALAVLVAKVALASRKRRGVPDFSSWRRSVGCLRAHREGGAFTVLLLILWYVLFAWYNTVFDSPRFFLPLSPVVQCALASTLVLGVRTVLDELPWPRGNVRAAVVNLGYVVLAMLMIVTTSGQIISHITAGELVDPFHSDIEQNASGDLVLEWLVSQEDEIPVRLLYGPSKSLGIWRYVEVISHENIPSDLSGWDEMTSFIEGRRLSWAIVDFDMVDRRPDLLGEYFSLDGQRVTLKQPPPGWVLVQEVETPRDHWFVFKIVQE